LPAITSETMHISPQWPFAADDTSTIEGVMYRVKLIEKTGRYEKSEDNIFFAS